MKIAYRIAIEALRMGQPAVAVHRMQKSEVAFAGSMRRNLVAMFDEIGLAAALRVDSSNDLFESDLLHTTSALRFPVFKRGKNYAGTGPSPMRHDALVSMVEDPLGPDLRALSDALILPLGVAASSCVQHLASTDALDPARCLWGFPHPSGANGHRLAQFAAEKDRLAAAVRTWSAR